VRLLICGGRDLDEVKALYVIGEWMFVNIPDSRELEIIHGGAKGADSAANTFARRWCIPVTVYKADWNKYGKAAGMIRNRIMLTEGQPDAILALTGGYGTANMMQIGRAAGIPVHELECK
jgi:hypothetical protein